MKYDNIIYGTFVRRLNRFTAVAEICGGEQLVHVKNTGRCSQVLVEGAKVALQPAANPDRKTAYDLISALSSDNGWVNIDSTAPNVVAGEWLAEQDFTFVHPEHKYGASRIDFYMERGSERFLMEVKGCTFREGDTGYFPDAPTERGIRHLSELSRAVSEGCTAIAAYVIPMNGVMTVRPNMSIHPEYGYALDAAVKAGVKVLFLRCRCEADSLAITSAAYADTICTNIQKR